MNKTHTNNNTITDWYSLYPDGFRRMLSLRLSPGNNVLVTVLSTSTSPSLLLELVVSILAGRWGLSCVWNRFRYDAPVVEIEMVCIYIYLHTALEDGGRQAGKRLTRRLQVLSARIDPIHNQSQNLKMLCEVFVRIEHMEDGSKIPVRVQ